MADDQPLEKRVGLALQIAKQEKDIKGNILTTVYEQIEQLRGYDAAKGQRDAIFRAHHTIASFLLEMGYDEFDLAHLAKLERVKYEKKEYTNGGPYYLEVEFGETRLTHLSVEEYGRREAEKRSVVLGTHPLFNAGNYLAKLLKIAVEADAIRNEEEK